MAALPKKGRLADLGFLQAYHITERQGSSRFTRVHAVSTFGAQVAIADQLDAVGGVPAAYGLGHLGPGHAVDEPQAEDHAGLVILDAADVLLQLFLLLGTLRFEMIDPALLVPDFNGQVAHFVRYPRRMGHPRDYLRPQPCRCVQG